MSVLDDRLTAFATACKTKFDALNSLISVLVSPFITPKQYGAVNDGTTDDSASFSAMQSARLAAKITGYGYANGVQRAYIPSCVSRQSAPIDLYGAGILQGDAGGIGGGGTSVLKFDTNVTGLRLQYQNTSGETTYSTAVTSPSSSGSIIRTLTLYGANTGSDATHPGIRIKAPVKIEDVFINGFAGDGITANAQLSSPGADPNNSSAYGNASSTQVYSSWVQNCLNGVKFQGADASIFTVLGSSAVSNRGYGFADYSFFGGLWMGLHAAANTLGAYFSDPAQSSAHPTFLHCYEEGGQPGSTFGPGTLILGGSWATYPSGGGYLYASANTIRVNNFGSDGNIQATGNSSALGPTTGAPADSTLYLETTNVNSNLYFRSWSGGTPTVNGKIYGVSGSGIKYDATNFHQHYIAGNRIFYVDSGGLKLDTGKTIQINAQQVVGARDTGWTADTGTARKASNATYTAGSTLTYSASYTQSELTATGTRIASIEAALQNISQTQKALKDALIAHGLIG